MKITDIDVAKAVIAHEAVDCFLGAEAPTSEQPADLVSSTGGTFWGRRGEEWPRSAKGKPLIPWLQVVCSEMKGLYGPFYRRQAVCFFLDEGFSDAAAVSNEGVAEFVVRQYAPGEELAPLSRPEALSRHEFHRVAWTKTPDFPSVSKYYDLFEDSVYSAICDDEHFPYENRSGIKIGGWPTPVQTDQRYPGEFDLQIDMTKNYRYGDSGIGYLKARGDRWHLVFECC